MRNAMRNFKGKIAPNVKRNVLRKNLINKSARAVFSLQKHFVQWAFDNLKRNKI